jgi:LmbE family N-acetylglucosaminyl deacetylase
MWFEASPSARAFLRAANGVGSRGVEAVWSAGCFAAGSMARPSPQKWATTGHERVAVVAPHPDDELAGCCGTLLRHRMSGDAVLVLFVTDGSRSRALPIDPFAMAQQRELESRAATQRLDAKREWLGLREGHWSDEAGRHALLEALRKMNPTVIYTPSHIDFHPEHRRVASALAEVLVKLDAKPSVRLYAVQVPLTPLLVNLVHDVSDLETGVRSTLSAYASQRRTLQCVFRSRRYAARFYGAPKEAEAFFAVSAELFALLHRRSPATFRPMGLRAWTDPLSLVRGAGERLRWRRIARAAATSAE